MIHQKKMILLSCAVMSTLWIYSCINAPNFSDIPEIEFVSFSKLALNQAPLNSDTILLTISFTDGDGDIGFDENSPGVNLIIIDNRTDQFYDRFRIPAIPEQGANNGVSGDIRMVLLNTCCVFPPVASIPNCESPPNFPFNDLSFRVFMVDRAGNKSNEITTPMIQLRCN